MLHFNFAFPATLSTDNFDFPFRDRPLFTGRGGGGELYLGGGSIIFELHFGEGGLKKNL